MRAPTGPGVLPALRRKARQRGVPVSVLLAEREQAGFDLLTAACERVATNQERVDIIRSAIDGGHLPVTGGGRACTSS